MSGKDEIHGVDSGDITNWRSPDYSFIMQADVEAPATSRKFTPSAVTASAANAKAPAF